MRREPDRGGGPPHGNGGRPPWGGTTAYEPDDPAPRPRRAPRTGLRRLVPTWRMALGTASVLVLLAAGAFLFLYTTVAVPDPNAQAVAESNVYYYADGTELGRTGAVNRESVPLGEVSPAMQHAVVSAEDRSFYRNTGVDLKGTLRAAWNTVTGRGTQGGSTITQQYVKNYYLSQEQTVARKAKEVVIALKVDRTESKRQILDGYLNTSYFGRDAYGVQAAAHAYYGTDAAHLNAAESAYLAALLQAPSAYDVGSASPAGRRAALARWNYVLDGMVKEHWLSPAERRAARFPEPLAPRAAPGSAGPAGYLIDIADQYLLGHHVIDEATLRAGGWRITTTFDRRRQQELAAAVKKELTDELDPRARPADRDVRVGAASVDPATGRIVAAYGGPDHATQPYDDATREDVQVGSTFKPFDLAAGLQYRGRTRDGRPITTHTYYDGTSGRTVQGAPAHYAPPNEDHRDYGRITLREAMKKSVNSVYAQEAVDAGLGRVRAIAIAAGLPSDIGGMNPSNPSMALGTATPSPLDMAHAYATFADHGRRTAPWAVRRLERDGQPTALPQHPHTTAMDRETADRVTSVLEGVISPDGTGYAALGLHRPAAGKTGTTDDNRSAWFVGYTPGLTTSVCVFREDRTTHRRLSLAGTAGLPRINGGTFPARIWTDYTAAALRGTPVQGFDLRTGGDTGAGYPPTQTPSPSPSPSTPPPTPGTPTAPTAPTTTPVPSAPGTPGTPSGPPTTPAPTGSTGPGPTPSPSPSGSGVGGSGGGGGGPGGPTRIGPVPAVPPP